MSLCMLKRSKELSKLVVYIVVVVVIFTIPICIYIYIYIKSAIYQFEYICIYTARSPAPKGSGVGSPTSTLKAFWPFTSASSGTKLDNGACCTRIQRILYIYIFILFYSSLYWILANSCSKR